MLFCRTKARAKAQLTAPTTTRPMTGCQCPWDQYRDPWRVLSRWVESSSRALGASVGQMESPRPDHPHHPVRATRHLQWTWCSPPVIDRCSTYMDMCLGMWITPGGPSIFGECRDGASRALPAHPFSPSTLRELQIQDPGFLLPVLVPRMRVVHPVGSREGGIQCLSVVQLDDSLYPTTIYCLVVIAE